MFVRRGSRAAVVMLLPLVVVAGCLLVGRVLGSGQDEPDERSAMVDPHAPSVILADWDARRAAAWADGDPVALAALYTPGSSAAESDRRLLDSYLDRGLVVEGMERQVLAVEVLERDETTLALRVTDRLAGATAVGPDPSVGPGTRLPSSAAMTRRVDLVLVDGIWLVRDVR